MAGRWIDAVRRNHALEHATVSVMLAKLGPTVRLVGRAVPDGFYIYGRIPTDTIYRSAEEGLARLKRGESHLAVTPLCGTNVAVAALLAGTLSFLSMGSRRQFGRLPNVIMTATLGILAAQPLGRLVQEHFTTCSDVAGLSLLRIETSLGGRVHKVKTIPGP